MADKAKGDSSGEKRPRLNLDKPRYDQSTYIGRAKHFFIITNPLNIFVLRGRLFFARKVVESYKYIVVNQTERIENKLNFNVLPSILQKRRRLAIHGRRDMALQAFVRLSLSSGYRRVDVCFWTNVCSSSHEYANYWLHDAFSSHKYVRPTPMGLARKINFKNLCLSVKGTDVLAIGESDIQCSCQLHQQQYARNG